MTSSRSQLAWSLSYLRPYRRGAIALIVLSAAEIAEKALRIAASICVFTNGNITVEVV